DRRADETLRGRTEPDPQKDFRQPEARGVRRFRRRGFTPHEKLPAAKSGMKRNHGLRCSEIVTRPRKKRAQTHFPLPAPKPDFQPVIPRARRNFTYSARREPLAEPPRERSQRRFFHRLIQKCFYSAIRFEYFSQKRDRKSTR